MHRFTTLAKKHEGTTTQESRDARNTNEGYPRGYHYKSSLFGFLLSLPERVQRAVTAWYQYKQQYKDSYDGAEDKLFRHIAYRQLARWCWGILGKEIRVVLPSCAVMCIRNFYPSPGPEEEFIFKGFRYADE